MSAIAELERASEKDMYSESFEDESEGIDTDVIDTNNKPESANKEFLESTQSSSSSSLFQEEEEEEEEAFQKQWEEEQREELERYKMSEKTEQHSKKESNSLLSDELVKETLDHKVLTMHSISSSTLSSEESSSASSADIYVHGSKPSIAESTNKSSNEHVQHRIDVNNNVKIDDNTSNHNKYDVNETSETSNMESSISEASVSKSRSATITTSMKNITDNSHSESNNSIKSNTIINATSSHAKENVNALLHVSPSPSSSSLSSSLLASSSHESSIIQQEKSVLNSQKEEQILHTSANKKELREEENNSSGSSNSKHSFKVSETESSTISISSAERDRDEELENANSDDEDSNNNKQAGTNMKTYAQKINQVNAFKDESIKQAAMNTDDNTATTDMYISENINATANQTDDNNYSSNDNNINNYDNSDTVIVAEYDENDGTDNNVSSSPTPRPHAAAGKRRFDGSLLNEEDLCRLGKPHKTKRSKPHATQTNSQNLHANHSQSHKHALHSRSGNNRHCYGQNKQSQHSRQTSKPKRKLQSYSCEQVEEQQEENNNSYHEKERSEFNEEEDHMENEPKAKVVQNVVISVEPAAVPETLDEMNEMQQSNNELREEIFALQRKHYEKMQRAQVTALTHVNNNSNNYFSNTNYNGCNTMMSSTNHNYRGNGLTSFNFAATMPFRTSTNSREQMELSRREATIRAVQRSVLLEETAQVLKREQQELRERVGKLQDLIHRYERGQVYHQLIAEANHDIATLSEEHRELQLQMRFNDRLLVADEEVMQSGEGERRLREELRAQTALCERALIHALRDYEDAERQRNGFAQKINVMEAEIAERQSRFTPEALETLQTLRNEDAQKTHELKELYQKLNFSHIESEEKTRYNKANAKNDHAPVNEKVVKHSRKIKSMESVPRYKTHSSSVQQKRNVSRNKEVNEEGQALPSPSRHRYRREQQQQQPLYQSHNKKTNRGKGTAVTDTLQEATGKDYSATERNYLLERVETLKAQLQRMENKSQREKQTKANELPIESTTPYVPQSSSNPNKHENNKVANVIIDNDNCQNTSRETFSNDNDLVFIENVTDKEVELTPAPLQESKTNIATQSSNKSANISTNTSEEINCLDAFNSKSNEVTNVGNTVTTKTTTTSAQNETTNLLHNQYIQENNAMQGEDARSHEDRKVNEDKEFEKEAETKTAVWLTNDATDEMLDIDKILDDKNNYNKEEVNEKTLNEQAVINKEEVICEESNVKKHDDKRELEEEELEEEEVEEEEEYEYEYEELSEHEKEEQPANEHKLIWEEEEEEELEANHPNKMNEYASESNTSNKTNTNVAELKHHEWLDASEDQKVINKADVGSTIKSKEVEPNIVTQLYSEDKLHQMNLNVHEKVNQKENNSGPDWLQDDVEVNNTHVNEKNIIWKYENDKVTNASTTDKTSNVVHEHLINTSPNGDVAMEENDANASKSNDYVNNVSNKVLDNLFVDDNHDKEGNVENNVHNAEMNAKTHVSHVNKPLEESKEMREEQKTNKQQNKLHEGEEEEEEYADDNDYEESNQEEQQEEEQDEYEYEYEEEQEEQEEHQKQREEELLWEEEQQLDEGKANTNITNIKKKNELIQNNDDKSIKNDTAQSATNVDTEPD